MKIFKIPLINRLLNYSWGTFLNKFLIFLLLPLLSRVLQPEEYAVYSILLLFAALVSHFFQMGLHQSLMTLYYKQPDNGAKLTLISTTWIAVGINSVLLTALILFLRQPLGALLINSNQDFSLLVSLTALMVFLDVFYSLTLVLLNIRQQSKEYSILNLTKNLVTIAGVFLLSFCHYLDIKTFFFVIVTASLVSLLHSLFYFKSIWRELTNNNLPYSRFSFPLFKTILRFGIFMVPATFAVISLQSADRYMLNLLSERTLYDAGIYAIAYKIGMIMSLFTVVFDLLFFPYIMQENNMQLAKNRLRMLFSFYAFSGTLIAVLIILFSREIFLVLDSSYNEGASLVFFGVISMFLRGMSNILVLGFYLIKRSEAIALASALAALLNILLNWLWIPHYGILGAGFASIIAYLFIVIFNYVSVERVFKAGYKAGWIAASLLIMIIVSFLNYSFTTVNWQMFAIKLALSAFLGLLGYLYITKRGYVNYLIGRVKDKL
ncbi:MAG: oligosaccharide flippase family protein [Candidatus Cloacimonetes bacterium]|nr:oligosaccharide flippase family protein [Candidatus Cloacimonadota bacterium]